MAGNSKKRKNEQPHKGQPEETSITEPQGSYVISEAEVDRIEVITEPSPSREERTTNSRHKIDYAQQRVMNLEGEYTKEYRKKIEELYYDILAILDRKLHYKNDTSFAFHIETEVLRYSNYYAQERVSGIAIMQLIKALQALKEIILHDEDSEATTYLKTLEAIIEVPRQHRTATVRDQSHLNFDSWSRMADNLESVAINFLLAKDWQANLKRWAVVFADFLEEVVKDTPNVSYLQTLVQNADEVASSGRDGAEKLIREKLPNIYNVNIDQWRKTDIHLLGLLNTVLTQFQLSLTTVKRWKQEKQVHFEKIYEQLKLLNSTGIIPSKRMREIEAAIKGVSEQSVGVRLWSAIQPLVKPAEEQGQAVQIPGVYPHSVDFLETFLTTEKSINQLARESNGKWTAAGVHKSIHTTLQRVWDYIPPEARHGLPSSDEALKEVAGSDIKVAARSKKMREGWDRLRKPDTGAIEFSPDHHAHLSEAASRRQQRIREMKQAEAPQDQI